MLLLWGNRESKKYDGWDIEIRRHFYFILFYFIFILVTSLLPWLEREKITPDTFILQAVNRPLIYTIQRLLDLSCY